LAILTLDLFVGVVVLYIDVLFFESTDFYLVAEKRKEIMYRIIVKLV
jgi:hypothetical protein